MKFYQEDTITAKKIFNLVQKYFKLSKIKIELNCKGDICFRRTIHIITGEKKLMFRFDIISAYTYFAMRKVYYQNRVSPKIENFFDYIIAIVLHETKHYIDYLKMGELYITKYDLEKKLFGHDNVSFEREADKFSYEYFKEIKSFIKEKLYG